MRKQEFFKKTLKYLFKKLIRIVIKISLSKVIQFLRDDTFFRVSLAEHQECHCYVSFYYNKCKK